MIIPVILSGGSGTRMWPLSRSHYPKQFLPLDRVKNFSKEHSTSLINTLKSHPVKACQIMAPKSGDIIEKDLTDDLRITFSNSDIVHLRPSGNAPELRCYAESDS